MQSNISLEALLKSNIRQTCSFHTDKEYTKDKYRTCSNYMKRFTSCMNVLCHKRSEWFE